MSEFAEYAPGRRAPTPFSETAELRIRAADESDLARLAPISAAREGYPLEQGLDRLARFFAMTKTGRALLLVAEIGAAAVGFGKASYFTPAADAPPNVAPEGWYLSGVVVSPAYRRRGVGTRLTAARLAWIASLGGGAGAGAGADAGPERAIYYFANERNQVSIELHRAFGFEELTRDFSHPHARFEGGAGILFVRRGPAGGESLE